MYMKKTTIASNASQSHSICYSAKTNVDADDTHSTTYKLVEVAIGLEFDHALLQKRILTKEFFTGLPLALRQFS